MKSNSLVYFVLTLVILTSTSFSQSFNLDSLLIESVGGPVAVNKIESMKSYRATGKVNWNGIEGDYTAEFMAPNKLRIATDFGEFSMIQGYNGAMPWQQDIHGRVFELYGSERLELIRTVYLMSFAYLPKTGRTGDCNFVQTIHDDSLGFHEVNCVHEPGDSILFLFDESSGHLQTVGALLDNIVIVTVSEDFRNVDNVLIPFYSMTSSPQAPIYSEVAIEKFEFNVDINPEIFNEPVTNFTDFHFPPDSQSVSIPFINENGHIIVVAMVNGKKKGRFILDTGASATYYHSEFVNDLNLTPIGEVPAMGLGGFQNLNLVKFDSLTFGKLAMYDQTAGVMPLYELELQTVDEIPFGGILGYDFFVRFPMLFDFKSEKLTVFNPRNFTPLKKGTEISFRLNMMVPTIKARIADYEGDFLVDVGNAFGLVLNKNYGDELLSAGIINNDGPSRSLGGIGQGVVGKNVEISQLTAQNKVLRIPEAILVESSEGLTGSRTIAGNIGTKVLKQYSVLFDYPNQRLIIYDL